MIHKQTKLFDLIISISLFISISITVIPFLHVNANERYRYIRTTKIDKHFYENNIHKFKSRRLKHVDNLKRYRKYQHFHKLNISKIKHRRQQHQFHKHQNKLIFRNHDYGFYHNYEHDIDTVDPKNYYREVSGNDRIIFSHPMYLHYVKYTGRRNNHGYSHGDPQSMSILPNGHIYVLFNVGHGDSSTDRIIEYNIKNGKKIRIGHKFHGGHGQGLSYDYKTRQLWACMNHYHNVGYPHGILPKVLLLAQINQKKLIPTGHWIHVKTKFMLGDNIAYDRTGDYWNVARNYFRNKKIPLNSLQIYQGHNRKIRLVKDILNSPSACIQNLTYNPDTNRLYVIGNGAIMSFPANQVRRLTDHNVKVAIMNHHSEFEDMGFWNHHAYLLVHPNRILQSNKAF